MSTEAIDIVVREQGAADAGKKIEGLGTSADAAGSSVDVLMESLKKSRSDTEALKSEVARLSGELEKLQKSSEEGGKSHKKHTNEVVGLKREMAGTQRTVNFFARALNDIIPASSAAGEGLRVLGSGLVSGFGIGLGIEAVLAVLKLLGESMEREKKEAFEAAEAVGKHSAMLREGKESIEEFSASLLAHGKGETWLQGQMRGAQRETAKLGDEMGVARMKIEAMSQGGLGTFDRFKHALGIKTEFDDLVRGLNRVENEIAVLAQKKILISIDYNEKVIPKLIESDELARREAAKRAAAGINDQSLNRSRGQIWTREQGAEIEAEIAALRRMQAEVQVTRDHASGLHEQTLLDSRLKGIQKEIQGYTDLKGKIGEFARPIDLAQGREVAYRQEVEGAQAARRAITEAHLVGASEAQAIEIRAGAALIEQQTKTSRTIREMVGAAEADKNRVRAVGEQEATSIAAKAATERARLMERGGSAAPVRSQIDTAFGAGIRERETRRTLQLGWLEGSIKDVDELNRLLFLARKHTEDLQDPVGALTRQYGREAQALQYVGDAREVETEFVTQEHALLLKGIELRERDTGAITAQGFALKGEIAARVERNKLAQEEQSLFEKFVGPQDKARRGLVAADRLEGIGALSPFQAEQARAEYRLGSGEGTLDDHLMKSFGLLEVGAEKTANKVRESFATATKGISDGFADAVGRSVAYGDNLFIGLRDAGQQALASLVSENLKIAARSGLAAMLPEGAKTTLGPLLGDKAAGATAIGPQLAALGTGATTAGASLGTFSAVTGGATTALGALAEAAAYAAAAQGGKAVAIPSLPIIGGGAEESAVWVAGGGVVRGPGTGTSDSIRARLSNGEGVLNAAAVDYYGPGMITAMNERRFAGGGLVDTTIPRSMRASSPPAPASGLTLNLIDKSSRGFADLDVRTRQTGPTTFDVEFVEKIAQHVVERDAGRIAGRAIANPSHVAHRDVRRAFGLKPQRP